MKVATFPQTQQRGEVAEVEVDAEGDVEVAILCETFLVVGDLSVFILYSNGEVSPFKGIATKCAFVLPPVAVGVLEVMAQQTCGMFVNPLKKNY